MAAALTRLCLVLGFMLLPLHDVIADVSVGIRSEALLASPAMAIDELDSSWESPSEGDYAQGRASWEVYTQLNDNLQLGVHQRWHYLLAFSPQTAQFYSRLENNQIDSGTYNLDFRMNAAQARGLFAQYFIPLSSSSSISVKATVLKGQRVQKGELTGTGLVSGDAFAYDWNLNYAYDENRIFDGPRSSPQGWGYSFDVYAMHQFNERHYLELSLEDLFYTLYWQEIEQDKGCLDRPLSSSCRVFSSKKTFVQRFPVMATMKWGYQFQSLQTNVKIESWQRYRALWLGLDYQGLLLEVDGINEMLNIGYESTGLKVKWAFDDVRYSNAKHWQLALDMNWPIL